MESNGKGKYYIPEDGATQVNFSRYVIAIWYTFLTIDKYKKISCGAGCLSAVCCYSEVAPSNPTKRVGLVQSGHHHLIEN